MKQTKSKVSWQDFHKVTFILAIVAVGVRRICAEQSAILSSYYPL